MEKIPEHQREKVGDILLSTSWDIEENCFMLNISDPTHGQVGIVEIGQSKNIAFEVFEEAKALAQNATSHELRKIIYEKYENPRKDSKVATDRGQIIAQLKKLGFSQNVPAIIDWNGNAAIFEVAMPTCEDFTIENGNIPEISVPASWEQRIGISAQFEDALKVRDLIDSLFSPKTRPIAEIRWKVIEFCKELVIKE